MAAAELPSFTVLTNLACSRQGAKVLFATDEWFAPASMFLELDAPVFKEGLFTDFGKWMDGWESRRKRTAGHDWCVIELGFPGKVRGFHFDTAFFTGNNVPAIGIQACRCPGLKMPENLTGTSGAMGTCATPEDVSKADEYLRSAATWHELLPKSPLGPGYDASRHNYYRSTSDEVVTHIRVNYYPDGGVARLRVHGEVQLAWGAADGQKVIDFAASWNGGAVLAWSNAHYGSPQNCIAPGLAAKMDEGWETARNPNRPSVLTCKADGLIDFDYARDWFAMKLGARCCVEEIELDTRHYKGNFPESCLIEGLDCPSFAELPLLDQKEKHASVWPPALKAGDKSNGKAEESRKRKAPDAEEESFEWRTLMPRIKCGPHEQVKLRKADGKILDCGPVTHLRVNIFPDGGLSRVRVHGRLALASK